MRLAVLPLAFLILAAPAAAQIGINGTRQAATTGPIDIPIGSLSRCGRASREAVALAGRGARGVERERIEMRYRRLRYAGSGLTPAEQEALEQQEERLDRAAQSGHRSYPRTSGLRRHAGDNRRPAYGRGSC